MQPLFTKASWRGSSAPTVGGCGEDDDGEEGAAAGYRTPPQPLGRALASVGPPPPRGDFRAIKLGVSILGAPGCLDISLSIWQGARISIYDRRAGARHPRDKNKARNQGGKVSGLGSCLKRAEGGKNHLPRKGEMGFAPLTKRDVAAARKVL